MEWMKTGLDDPYINWLTHNKGYQSNKSIIHDKYSNVQHL